MVTEPLPFFAPVVVRREIPNIIALTDRIGYPLAKKPQKKIESLALERQSNNFAVAEFTALRRYIRNFAVTSVPS